MAQRRLRALGMLGALGATDATSASRWSPTARSSASSAPWPAPSSAWRHGSRFAPTLRDIADHRVDRFDLPWWAIAAAMVLAVVTAVVAAWWPARAAPDASIVAALSGRPSPPKPAHRFAGAGVVLARRRASPASRSRTASQRSRDGRRPRTRPLIIGGTVAPRSGCCSLGPAVHPGARRARSTAHDRGTARAARPRPLPGPLRRRRSAPSASRSPSPRPSPISAAAAISPASAGSLPANELLVHLTASNDNFIVNGQPVLPDWNARQLATIDRRAHALAATLHARGRHTAHPGLRSTDRARTGSAGARRPRRRVGRPEPRCNATHRRNAIRRTSCPPASATSPSTPTATARATTLRTRPRCTSRRQRSSSTTASTRRVLDTADIITSRTDPRRRLTCSAPVRADTLEGRQHARRPHAPTQWQTDDPARQLAHLHVRSQHASFTPHASRHSVCNRCRRAGWSETLHALTSHAE